MRLSFWGVRGSIPKPQSSEELRSKVKKILSLANGKDLGSDEKIESFIKALPFFLRNNYGGNTTCLEINDDDGNVFIIDAGSGIKNLGKDFLSREGKPDTVNLFFTHFHWDHIQGFPFFIPAYMPNITINFYSPISNLKKAITSQQNKVNFPVFLNDMPSKKTFNRMDSKKGIRIGNTLVKCLHMNHPGGGTAYSFTNNNKKIVFTGDVEFLETDIAHIDDKFGDFFKNADVAVFDSQYSLEESFSKFDWGHTTYTMAINLAVNWNVKKLILTHHDPYYPDAKIFKIEKDAKAHLANLRDTKMTLAEAYEGLSIKF